MKIVIAIIPSQQLVSNSSELSSICVIVTPLMFSIKISSFLQKKSPYYMSNFYSLSFPNPLHRNIIQSTLKAHHPTIQSLDNSCTIKQLGAAIEGLNLKTDGSQSAFFTPEMMTKNAFENVKEKGLLHKIVLLLNRVHPNSSFSFWLASCIESFLRGFHVPHQIFVAHTGMLHKLVKQIVSNEITRFNNIQISYDLLGEIVKFNKHNIIFLENLCVNYGWVNQLPQHALCNVVDSNVFFRSLWLSFERFDYNFVLQVKKYFWTRVKSSRNKEILKVKTFKTSGKSLKCAKPSIKMVSDGLDCSSKLLNRA